ncbi:MAG: HupE/UreJ family protein [Pseudomonadota bacterium]|jgi:urease accessory protein
MTRKMWFGVPALLASGAAMAHGGHDHMHGFIAGLAHPFGGLDHLLAMLGVGLFAGMLGGSSRLRLPLAFVAAMTLGAVAGLAGIGSGAPTEQLIALGVLAIGLAIAFAIRAGPVLTTALVAAGALFHGQAHGAELPAQADALAYVAGFVLSTAALHVGGLALAAALRTARNDLGAARGVGGAIAIAGLVLALV